MIEAEASEYLVDDRPADEPEFTRLACDPRASVVVEACAGSGKTWLLVGRIVRLLLAGAAPGDILAITFTRRAAQEMRTRLLRDLQELAQADDAAVAGFLCLRGMPPEDAHASIDAARALYERVLTARVPITIDTFHGWYWRLAQNAPLGQGVPFAPVLIEGTDRLRVDAWLHFSAALLKEEHAQERQAWEVMLAQIGGESARRLLQAFLQRRAEWWSFARGREDRAIDLALEPFAAAGADDPAAQIRDDAYIGAVQVLLDLWRSAPSPGSTLVKKIDETDAWLAARDPRPARDFRHGSEVLFTKDKEPTPRKFFLPEDFAPKLPPGNARLRYSEAHARAVAHIQHVAERRALWRARTVNRAALVCGRLLIDCYQALKAQQQALDFTDLEWSIHRLLADPDNTAYMQSRLDARYRHLLLDEFQDTNPLQWQVLQSWLAGYDGSDGRPSVFIVGDPKQSIYRFRRADPRIFEAARALLGRDFGAAYLRTNVTRRNAPALVDVFNRVMPHANPLYQRQRTRAVGEGAFVLLQLAEAPQVQPKEVAPAEPRLRDVLTTSRTERDNETRYREGRLLANEIAHRVARMQVEEMRDGKRLFRPARWSDVLTLVRRRTHLADYERAFRDAGVPFISDRSGGLLATLEADDLVALLEFLAAPFNDLKLAHALRSPVFGCTDEDLQRLATASGATWWRRLQVLGEAGGERLWRARQLLATWEKLAGELPVHDVLDRIYHDADVRRRYAEVAPAALHAQVQANLDAFMELALDIDAGRYPSLPRFVDELAQLKPDWSQRYALDEAPDEGVADAADAVRIMTIHGAKGLEAEIVAVADANNALLFNEESVLVVWPPEEAAPRHVSLVPRGTAALDTARREWFRDEERERVQEDANLLYVAATRARRVLIVSGAQAKSEDPSWYGWLEEARDLAEPDAPAEAPSTAAIERTMRDYLPAPVPTGSRQPLPADSEAIRLGSAWHALLEQGDAALELIARAHALTPKQKQMVVDAAARVRMRLAHLFDGAAEAELDIVAADGELLRIDRLVELDDALWIVDFKWRLTEGERGAYEAQVRRYADVLSEVRSDKPVRLGLVLADGSLVEVALAPPAAAAAASAAASDTTR